MALGFLTGGSRVHLGSLNELSGASSMTLCMWIKLSDATSDMAIVLRGSSFVSTAPFLLWRDTVAVVSGRTNTLSCIVNTNSGTLRLEGSTDLLNDTTNWHHLALVFEASSSTGLRIYVDGVMDSYPTSTVGHTQLVNDTSDATLGYANTSQELLADIAEFAAWDEPLSDDEIARLASGTTMLSLPAAIDRLVCYHDLIRSVNRPGIGNIASSTGSFAPSSHPRQIASRSFPSFVSAAHRLLAGPHDAEQAEVQQATQAAGQIFLPGVSAGTITPIGEVHN